MTRSAPESDIGQRTKGFYELWRVMVVVTLPVNCHSDVENAPHNQLGQPKEYSDSPVCGTYGESQTENGLRFTIITTEPNELVRPIHNRLPVILRPKDEEQRLDTSRTPFVKLNQC